MEAFFILRERFTQLYKWFLYKMRKPMKKAGGIFKRLLIVIYFFVTIPLLIAGVFVSNSERLEDTAYYFSTDKTEEIGWIIKILVYKDAPENKIKELTSLNNEELLNRFLEKNPEEQGNFRKFLDWDQTSRQFANDYLDYKTLDSLWKHYRMSEIIKLILLDLLVILIYILLTDFLAKTLTYIIEWKFGWWINYKKLFRRKS